MSRGPGVWQRAVVEATRAEIGSWLSVEAVAADHFVVNVDRGPFRAASTLTPAERESIRRAIRILSARGVVSSRHNAAGELEVTDVRTITIVDDEHLESVLAELAGKFAPGDRL